MPFTQDRYAIGTHVFIFPEGKTYSDPDPGGTASKTAKPAATDAGWVDIGVIEEAADSPVEGTELPIFGPTPGRLRKTNVVVVKDERKIKFTTKELSTLAMQILYRTGDITNGQFNTMEGKPMKCWLKIQRYDQNDNQRITEDLWVYLKASGDVNMGGAEVAAVAFEADVLYSTLNTGNLS